jgi:hypothetical protein
MQSIQQTLKNASVGGAIPVDKAIKLAAGYDAERIQVVEILKECEKNVGMTLGGEILKLIAKITGGHFSEVEYNYEKPVGEQ